MTIQPHFSPTRTAHGPGHIIPMPRLDPVTNYLRELVDALGALSQEDIWAAADMLVAVAQAGRRIYVLGNGGSAATASHMVNDLNKQASVPGQLLFRAMALTDNVPLLTAWSNDDDYAECFAQQLANFVEPGDVVVAISTSGGSPNVLRALEQARRAGARTIGLTGDKGGRMRRMVDLCLFVPSANIGQQEDVHLVLNHLLTTAIRSRLVAL